MKEARKVPFLAMAVAFSVVLGYVELLFPMPVAGAKLGLANLAVLLVLYLWDTRDAFFVTVARVLLSSLLFGGFSAFWFSMAGAVLSFWVMVLIKKWDVCSIVGVSMAGGVCHNMGQLLVACLVVEDIRLVSFLPVFLVTGLVCGCVIDLLARFLLPYLDRKH